MTNQLPSGEFLNYGGKNGQFALYYDYTMEQGEAMNLKKREAIKKHRVKAKKAKEKRQATKKTAKSRG